MGSVSLSVNVCILVVVFSILYSAYSVIDFIVQFVAVLQFQYCARLA